jgi:hypothetical protein
MNRTTFQTTLGGVLTLALGAVAGTWHARSTSGTPAENTKAVATASNAGERPASAALTEAVRKATGAHKWLLLASAAEHATVKDLPGLIRLAGEDDVAVRMLAARWAELNPRHMFSSLYADFMLPDGSPAALPSRWALTDALFEQWTKTDPAAVVKAMNEVPDFPGREGLRMTVSNQIFKVDVEQGLRVMNEWGIRNYSPEMKKVQEWAARDPRHAAEVVVQFGREYAGQEALRQVGKAWAQKDPEGGMRFAATLNSDSRKALASELMSQWATKDLAAAAKFASAEQDPSFRASFAQGLVGIWGKSDAKGALAWSQENLLGNARTEAVSGIIKAAAEKDIVKAADLVADMEPGSAQNRACGAIFETWFKKGGKEREAAFDWLAGLPDEDARRQALERVQWDWVWREPEAVRDFITGPRGNLASDSIVHQVVRGLTAKNPESAMDWANKLPADRAPEARWAVLDSWLGVRPEGAMKWARELPEGPERERAIRTVSQSLVWQSTQQAAEWYRSLSGASQKLARESFGSTSLSADKKKELEAAIGKE